jgi:CrcB protein
MREALWVSLGGFVGANARHLFGGWITSRVGSAFPYGTFVINATGSFVLGLVMGALEGRVLSPAVRLALAINFVGAYTTFSTWTSETIRLIETGGVLRATMSIVGSLLVGLLAAMG